MYHKALALLLFSSLLLTSFGHHVLDDEIPCIHDQLEHNPEMLDIEEDFSPADEGRDRRLSSNPNIRIYPYFDFLDSRTSSSFASYIRNDLVPPIIDYFQAALKVKYPVTGQLKLGSSVSKICERSTPSILRSGVDADFFMYYDIDTATSFVASAKYCHLASGSKRPLVARTSINTNRLSNAQNNVLVHEKNMYVLMHEMMHAMGFSNWLTKYYLDENGRTRTGHIKNVNIAGSTRTVIDVPPLTERLRNFYGCSSLQGAIMENQGGDGTALTHFERKYFLYESMTSGSIFGRRISEFSWAMLEGSGWYEVDYSYAEPYFYGKGKGCDFISTTCSNAASKFEEEYCTGSNRGCSPEGGGGGSCQSDSIMDGCRFYYPNEYQDCDNDDGYDNARLPDLQVYGRGAGSKCFTGTLNTRQSSNGKTSFCFKYTCVGSGSDTQVEVQVGNNRVTCTRKGTQTIDGYYGAVDCPDPETFCEGPGRQYCPKGCMGRGTCVNNKCVCNSGYSGVDCALRA